MVLHISVKTHINTPLYNNILNMQKFSWCVIFAVFMDEQLLAKI